MGGQEKKNSRWGKYLPFGSATSGSKDPNFASDPPGDLGSRQPDSDSRPPVEQSSGAQNPKQAALSPPTTSFTDRFFKFRSRSPSGKGRSNTPDQLIATSSSQSFAVPASVPARRHSSSYSDPSDLQTHGHGPSSPHDLDIHAAILSETKSISVIQPSSQSSMVWAKALEITKKKLSNSSLPPLDITNLTSQSAEENMAAVVQALNIAQEDDKKKRWSYTWRGKEVIVVERLGKILKSVEKYSKAVDTAIQSNPQVAALVWAGVLAIMRVRTPDYITLFRLTNTNLIPWAGRAESCRSNRGF